MVKMLIYARMTESSLSEAYFDGLRFLTLLGLCVRSILIKLYFCKLSKTRFCYRFFLIKDKLYFLTLFIHFACIEVLLFIDVFIFSVFHLFFTMNIAVVVDLVIHAKQRNTHTHITFN